ncbi:MarR family winged helix-turn-helix transcriptional regulator [Actinoalloteichus hymeniacidonis]|uniref:Transcriptional regulator n=1 Tax=Actinoalloteichus hymeniacidonis TaxID=340345 RepID=A0AAC9MXH2_9PSEU|nr:MarR family transcriptional regulator [Actinoalloteichus hymeniacidonis]AOS61877.1 transcriptional regulator [Actinoalloteichus hymeniacidonis]MBB5910103.1 DNA-binding MarR family transcriptional regulator [Actinoalloteichus hymeniacidonis]
MSPESDENAVLRFAFAVRKLTTELNAALATRFRPLGLTCVQAEALMALDALGPVTLKQLAEHLVAESGHPSRLISRLVDDGLVTRAASESDGRAVTLLLTERGRDLAAQARAARAPLVAEFARRHGDRLDATTDLMRELWTAMAEQQDSSRTM